MSHDPPTPPPATDAARQARVPARYLTLFLLLYAIQGVVFAYFITFNQGYLIAAGVSAESVGFIGFVVLLPFALKFLAAPLSDRLPIAGLGHRKPYILLGLVLQAAGLVALGWVDPGARLGLFTAMALLTVVGLALYDTCTDGMVIDITPPGDRERIQGLLIFARFLTAFVSTLALGYWLDRTGTGPETGYGVLWACAAVTLVPLALAARLPEPERIWQGEKFNWRALAVMIRPASLALLTFGTFYAIVQWGVEYALPIFHEQLGYDPWSYGTFGAAIKLGRAAGAIAVPLLAPWLGRRRALVLAVLTLAATEAAQALLGAEQPWRAIALSFAFGVAVGWVETMFYVLAMEHSDPRMAASTYALFMAVTNLNIIGSWLFLEVVGWLDGDFPTAFVGSAALTLLALALIRPLFRPAQAGGPSRA